MDFCWATANHTKPRLEVLSIHYPKALTNSGDLSRRSIDQQQSGLELMRLILTPQFCYKSYRELPACKAELALILYTIRARVTAGTMSARTRADGFL